jgi:hypothetical protein
MSEDSSSCDIEMREAETGAETETVSVSVARDERSVNLPTSTKDASNNEFSNGNNITDNFDNPPNTILSKKKASKSLSKTLDENSSSNCNSLPTTTDYDSSSKKLVVKILNPNTKSSKKSNKESSKKIPKEVPEKAAKKAKTKEIRKYHVLGEFIDS